MTTNPGKKVNEAANEADHNSRHPEPLTAQDSRANHKTVWTVTEDEELFKKYSIRAVVQTVLPDAVLWDELAARGNKSGPRPQRAQECNSKRVLHYARKERT